MKKKIGSSKSMKKMAMGGPGPKTDSIPSGPKISPAEMEMMKKRANSPYNKFPSDRSKTMEFRPGRDDAKRKTMEYVPSRDGGKMEFYKKGGSVGKKPKMAKGGSTPFGMLSVKAGVDNNPKPTAADRIAGAKMKKGGSVKSKKK
jgi:hypothetical protein